MGIDFADKPLPSPLQFAEEVNRMMIDNPDAVAISAWPDDHGPRCAAVTYVEMPYGIVFEMSIHFNRVQDGTFRAEYYLYDHNYATGGKPHPLDERYALNLTSGPDAESKFDMWRSFQESPLGNTVVLDSMFYYLSGGALTYFTDEVAQTTISPDRALGIIRSRIALRKPLLDTFPLTLADIREARAREQNNSANPMNIFLLAPGIG